MRSTNRTTSRTSRLAGALVAAGIGTGVLAGCGGTAGPETGVSVDEIQQESEVGADAGAVEPAEPEVGDPVTDGDTTATDLNAYIGQRVTVSAEVNQVFSPNAFTLAGTAGSGGAGELLVIAAQAPNTVTEESVVAVTGTVRQAFDLVGVETEYGYDDADTLYGDFEDKPYIVAESIDPTVSEPGGTMIEPAA